MQDPQKREKRPLKDPQKRKKRPLQAVLIVSLSAVSQAVSVLQAVLQAVS